VLLRFLLFISYVTIIFFLPNNLKNILLISGVNILYGFIRKIKYKKLFNSFVAFLPFLLLTFCLNVWLDSFMAASFVTIKLFLVWWVTMIYAQTIGVLEFAEIIRQLLAPLEKLGLETEAIMLMVTISLSLIPILRRDTNEMKMAIRAKGASLDLWCGRLIATRMMIRMLRRVEEIDEALRAKGVM